MRYLGKTLGIGMLGFFSLRQLGEYLRKLNNLVFFDHFHCLDLIIEKKVVSFLIRYST